ncbi:type II secretion system F family protein [Actinomadura opuntiae]|uniref:type II secretion system F family protein n=1 Tax=Actinomadura sp. OS1-43 TaxID=604315 RepID=UPI00255AF6CF|nr:type II secretion system F family protein [Actinomadura sp. OS1-43]MDL4818218.1 type II secretion system F family protein [Actinomadura sp. OS1-43]
MTDAISLAALCCAATTWLLLAPSPAGRRLDRLLGPEPEPGGPLPALKARVDTIKERRGRPARRRTAIIGLCDGMAAELAAGRTPEEAFALSAAVLDRHVSAELIDPKRPPPSFPAHLADLADEPGAEGLRLLAACWRIGSERGGTLATVLDGLAAALRDEEAQRQDVAVQLAGPRATARLLAGLPLLGLGMAAALGAHPLTFLCGSLPGLACLITGIALNATGLYWTRHLAKSAESPT